MMEHLLEVTQRIVVRTVYCEMGLKRQKLKNLGNLKMRSKLYDLQMQQATVGRMMGSTKKKKKQKKTKQLDGKQI